jgi:hypothetical protein
VDLNPYSSPHSNARPERRCRIDRLAYYGGAWCLFYLLPTLSLLVSLVLRMVGDFTASTEPMYLMNISKLIGFRADLVLLASFFGCAVVAALARLSPLARVMVVLGWFPLMVCEVVLILLGVSLVFGPPT